MPVERFTKAQFEAMLPEGKWEPLGLLDGEYVYTIRVWSTRRNDYTNKRIVIRSSIDASGWSAESGADSIRLWVEYYYAKAQKWMALGKLDRWTTRVPGWEQRVVEKLRELYQLALDDDNRGGVRNGNTGGSHGGASTDELDGKSRALASGETIKEEVKGNSEDGVWAGVAGGSISDSSGSDTPTRSSVSEVSGRDGGDQVVEDLKKALRTPPRKREPNPEQLQAITAPVEAAVRVLAPPGSGKTFVMELRNEFLLEQGVSPDHILNVTFSKPMADAGKERVVKTLRKKFPDLDLTEFERWYCTIHAMCYRMLKEEGDQRDVPEDWKVKRAIQEIAEPLWPYASERPGWKEIYLWVCMPKMYGLTSAEDLDFYLKRLQPTEARNLHETRRQFDNRMAHERLITFPDMLYDVEQKLLRDSTFREKWQAKFQVVNLDEAQDVSYQALRILITLSFDPTANPVYRK